MSREACLGTFRAVNASPGQWNTHSVHGCPGVPTVAATSARLPVPEWARWYGRDRGSRGSQVWVRSMVATRGSRRRLAGVVGRGTVVFAFLLTVVELAHALAVVLGGESAVGEPDLVIDLAVVGGHPAAGLILAVP